MTKRDFDKLTKMNHGCPMASDERGAYRQLRCYIHCEGDFLARRRAEVRPGLAVLDRGSKFRARAAWRAHMGYPLLGTIIDAKGRPTDHRPLP